MKSSQSQSSTTLHGADTHAEPSAAFTPGPWKVDFGHPRGLPGGISQDGGQRRCITRFGAIARPTTTEGFANARLLAAAPELLAALTELHLKAVIGTDAERHAALDQAWAAISKARGQ